MKVIHQITNPWSPGIKPDFFKGTADLIGSGSFSCVLFLPAQELLIDYTGIEIIWYLSQAVPSTWNYSLWVCSYKTGKACGHGNSWCTCQTLVCSHITLSTVLEICFSYCTSPFLHFGPFMHPIKLFIILQFWGILKINPVPWQTLSWKHDVTCHSFLLLSFAIESYACCLLTPLDCRQHMLKGFAPYPLYGSPSQCV